MFRNPASKLMIFATVSMILGIIGEIFLISSMEIATIMEIVLIIIVAISLWSNALVIVTFAEMAQNIETMSSRIYMMSNQPRNNDNQTKNDERNLRENSWRCSVCDKINYGSTCTCGTTRNMSARNMSERL